LNKADESADDKPAIVMDDKVMGEFWHIFRPLTHKKDGEGDGDVGEGEQEGSAMGGMWGMFANPFGVSFNRFYLYLCTTQALINFGRQYP
jgi:hypothetical protein